jgi:hypothetical protein
MIINLLFSSAEHWGASHVDLLITVAGLLVAIYAVIPEVVN